MAATPRSRADQQRATRDALVVAAREVFAEDGYHRANLGSIAARAGFSKGAVYSNFSGKAELFLAVIDGNMEAALGDQGWDLADAPADEAGCTPPEGLEEQIQGMGLATLEFITAAARDPHLREQMSQRMASVIDRYADTAERSRPPGDPLPSADVGALLTALDQGAALLMLSGSAVIDQRLLRTGLLRLLEPSEDEAAPDEPRGAPALHDAAIRQRLAAAARDQGWDAPDTQTGAR